VLEFTADSILWLILDMLGRRFRLGNFNKDCSIQTILQLLQMNLVLVQPGMRKIKLPTRVPETEHLDDSAKILKFQNTTALNLVSLT